MWSVFGGRIRAAISGRFGAFFVRRLKSPGRPKKSTKRDIRIQVLLNDDEYKLFVKAKERAGFESDSGFARMAAVRHSKRQK